MADITFPTFGDFSFSAVTNAPKPAAASRRAAVSTTETRLRHYARRFASEDALRASLPWHWERGATYHCISQGDVDSLTYLRVAVHQQPLDYLLLSTWCMGLEDAEEIAAWVSRGLVRRVDFYVGEIFTGSYGAVFDRCIDIARACGGRVAVFRNHAKVMLGAGPSFRFAIASSANVNTNPRCENTTVTVDDGVFAFYKEFFDGITAFNRDFDGWTPWKEGDSHA